MLRLGKSLQQDWHYLCEYAGAWHPAFAAHHTLNGRVLLCMLECHTCNNVQTERHGNAIDSSAAENSAAENMCHCDAAVGMWAGDALPGLHLPHHALSINGGVTSNVVDVTTLMG